METIFGIIGVLIFIIIGMIFGRILELTSLIYTGIRELFHKLF